MYSCLINIFDFWCYRRNIKDGYKGNSEFTLLCDLMAIFLVFHILLHHWNKYFYLLIMLKQKQTC